MIKPIQIALAPTRSRPLNVFLGVVLALASILLLLSLATYHTADPSLNTSIDPGTQGMVKNWIGPFGATMSDLALQTLGLTAFFVPIWMGAIAWGWTRSRWNGAAWLRGLGMVCAVAFVPVMFGLLPWHWQWMHAIPVEGVVGRLMAGLLVRYLNVQGAWLVAGVLAAAGVYFALALNFRAMYEWLSAHWVQLQVWNDRWQNWREERAEQKAERDAIKRGALLNEEQQNPGPSQSLYTGSAEGEAAANMRTPRGLASFFWRKREREIDPVEEIPAYQRQRAMDQMQDAGQPTVPVATAAEPVRRVAGKASIWERTVDAAGPAVAGVSAAQTAYAEAAQVQRPAAVPAPTQMPIPARVQEAYATPEPEQVPVTARYEAIQAHMEPEPAPAPVRQQPMAAMRAPQAAPVEESIEIHERADVEERMVTVAPKHVSGYKLPPSTLLLEGEGPQAVREEELREEARVLVEKCAEFDVRGQVVQINPGPMVTTYEFKPEAGVKYSRVTGLADDLCLAMRAESILIERMAGKSTVGIQVPNHERETIHLREVLESETFAKAKSRLTLAMGKDINGRIVTADLAGMPHVLIAGSTGSGKSVAINAMIMSLLFRTTPQQVRLILVDPKRVELGMYEGVPHLFTPIITEPKLAANALRNAVREMERRLKLLASRSVRNIDQYNKLFEGSSLSLFGQGLEADEEPLPYIVIVIDELADLMMLDRANVEESITRLAQMARAVGIHLVLATQRPSVDVITGLIKANVPTRISFRLSTKVDSRTIIDTNGAEALLGRGDMLFLPPGTSRLMRLHAPYVSEKETAAIVKFWKDQGNAEYAEGFLESPKDERASMEGGSGGEEENDPLYDDGVRLVFEFGKASTSLLQRRLRIGYGRAAHLIDLMERDGLVGPADGSRPRELLKAPGWLHEVSASAME
ncbi:DNA translocase FtsK [Terracidiphilus sp.]|jgi:S-DNA-T family DNA segregation ATPase FtsK/SpoIIIE|uniref:DNA translocase FtsK n=1 Tax=Terracidiphilus sp. TaxID=1964191 RepID=UPI003C180EBC